MIARTSIDWTARPYVAPSSHVAPARPRWLRPRLGAWIFSTAVLVGAAWWLAAPPQLGGTTSLVTVDGTSMLPMLHRDDLIALRASDSYRVGDVVGYRSGLLHRVVLHRIVAIHDGRYTFKGDNNAFLDPEHPARTQLVGKIWLRIPSAGRIVPLLHVPWVIGAIAALLVLALGLGGGSPPAHDAERLDPP